jgi:oligoendopeptidase F
MTLPQWDLSPLYTSPQDPKLTKDLARLANEAATFAQNAGQLEAIAQNKASFIALIERYENIDDGLGRIASYAGLLYAVNTTDPAVIKFYGDISDKITEIATNLIFFTLEINMIDDAIFEKACEGNKYAPWLKDLRKEKPYQLSEEIEQLLMEKSATGAQAWNRLFDETMTRLRFHVGEEELQLEQVLSLLQDTDAKKREAASHALAKTLEANLPLFSLITNTLAKDKDITDKKRGFDDVASSRNLSNRVEDEVVNALIEAVRDAYPRISHRYYALKAKWFGVTTLKSWDRNAPLPFTAQREFTWEEARKTVIDAYHGFLPAMATTAQAFFDENRIDAGVRVGKSSGAFAHPTTPSAKPYVMMNFMSKPRDVMTLAHELGHGVHQVLAGKQGALMCPTPLTLAETASVFGEMLTFKKLLSETENPAQKKALLAGKVEDMINTVVRQIAFYSFERKVHLARLEGELTPDDINALWMSVQGESLGPAIELGAGYETFWAYIPHFIHSPFYVYAYAFGDCLVNSLYAVYEKHPEGFQAKYMAMLEAGGTLHHSDLLKPFGLNAADPSFWQGGLSVLEGMISELEAME